MSALTERIASETGTDAASLRRAFPTRFDLAYAVVLRSTRERVDGQLTADDAARPRPTAWRTWSDGTWPSGGSIERPPRWAMNSCRSFAPSIRPGTERSSVSPVPTANIFGR
ncbi:hypothetical protein BJF83_02190 [Nocardiopsis sp. CNR-923]|nr:hypothetical protein BJF83_02190 [Nocardiopsis sp. CNR-923]